jgi:hypothetical protein
MAVALTVDAIKDATTKLPDEDKTSLATGLARPRTNGIGKWHGILRLEARRSCD